MNNRQNGRRRGRGGQQVRSGQPGNQDRGNRIDNRARGNAAQLLEKYKNLARDAQMSGDRVNTEYYLQFADHYFRVLSESRARFDEQRQQPDQQRGRRDDFRDEFGQDGDYEAEGQRYDAGEANWGDGDDDGRSQQRAPEQRQPEQRRPQPQLSPRQDDAPRTAQEGDEPAEGERRPRRPRRANGQNAYANGNGNGNGNGNAAEGVAGEQVSERIEIDRLPQALSPAPAPAGDAVEAADEEAPRPRRRAPRRPRSEEATVEA